MSIINEQLIALVEGAKRKDTRAIEFLYNEFYGEVYYTCYKILGSQEDAKDIAQDTFLEAFIGIDNLNQPLSFKFWINRIAANKSFNFLKRYNRINVSSREIVEQLSQVEDIEANPENVVIENDVRYTIESIMARLPQEQRRTLFLFYYQEMTVKEIAELYQCSESTVRSRLAYARKFMRREVEKLEDNGYKLRCLTALPFIFALFNAEKSTTTIIGQGNITAALNSYISSIPTANSNVMNNTINMSNQSLQQNIQTPNPTNKIYKMSAISKTTKITVAVISAVVVGAAILTGLLIHNHNKNEVPTDKNVVSTIVDDNSSQSNSKADDESQTPQTSSEPEKQIDTYIKWQFRDVEAPTFEDAKYTEIKPYKDFEEFSENQREKTEILATPSYYIDMDKAKEFIKNNELINNEFELAEAGEEHQNFFNSDIMGMQFKYNVYDIIYGYKPGTKEKELFYFKSNQKYSLYNTPNSYSLSITTEKMSQDDIYNIVKEIFGENIAEWAVYAKSDKEIKKESYSDYSYNVVVTTPNGKGKYKISRSIIRKGENKPYEFSIGIYFNDESTTLRNTYNGYEHYSNGYVPFDMDIPLSSLFDVDVGGTDISKPKEFFNKLLDSTGENEYIYTVLTSVSKNYIKFADGSIYNSYNIEASQGVKSPNYSEVVYYGADDLHLSVAATCDKDGNITDISDFAIVIPTGRITSSDYTNEVKVEKLIDLSIKKASELLNIPINELKESMSLFVDNPYIQYNTDKKEINLFGKTVNATIAFIVFSNSIGELQIKI